MFTKPTTSHFFPSRVQIMTSTYTNVIAISSEQCQDAQSAFEVILRIQPTVFLQPSPASSLSVFNGI